MIQAEVSGFIAEHSHLLDDEGRQSDTPRLFARARGNDRNRHSAPVQVPRVRGPGTNEDDSRIRFRPALVQPYLRKVKSVGDLLPWLYLKGLSTGDFSEAPAALPGPDAEGLSGLDDHTIESHVAGRVGGLAQTQSHGQALCLHPGQRGLFHAASRR